MPQKKTLRFWLCIGWILLVAIWAWWEWTHYSGLYHWLAEWQTAQWGQYEKAWTSIVPALLLMLPALLWLRRDAQSREAAAVSAGDAAAGVRQARKLSLIAALILGVVAIGAYGWSQQLPDPSDPPVEINLAALGNAVPPTGSASLTGAMPDTGRALLLEEQFRSTRSPDMDHQTIYVPIIADPSKAAAPPPATQPVRFFIDRASYAFADARKSGARDVFMAQNLRGVLIEDGLPAEVVAAFAKQGVVAAAPHYLLTTSSVGGRDNYYVITAICGFLAIIALIVAALQTRMIARAMRGD